MKTIEYPIKDMVSFEMDENKIWWLRYNKEHPSFPPITKKRVGMSVFNKKGYMDFVILTTQFCEENNFSLEGAGFGMISRWKKYPRRIMDWKRKDVMSHELPTLLFPYTPPEEFFESFDYYGDPLPYYGNDYYQRYIEDNNGECPLPFPKDIKWLDD